MASQKVRLWIWTKQGAKITHHGVLRNRHTRDHLFQQRENSCAPWFVQFLQKPHLIFPAQSIWINCFPEEVDIFLSRKIRMQSFSKHWVSWILDTKDLTCGNILGDIFEYTAHLTNLEFLCFYIRLWVCLPRFALVFSRKCKLLATLFNSFSDSIFYTIICIAHTSRILTYSHKYIVTSVMDIVVSVIMGAVTISRDD